MVYELVFFYWDDNPENDDYVIVAVYSSYELAEKGLEKFAEQPRFKGKRDAFIFVSMKLIKKAVHGQKAFLFQVQHFLGLIY